MADNKSEGTPEVDRDVRTDEAWKANIKRTYDEMQQESLETIRQCRGERADIHAIIVQTLANMSENANLAAKRSLDHWDKADVLSVANAGAAADAAIDQSPPDEGVRQAKTE
jgi:hypothetical protein